MGRLRVGGSSLAAVGGLFVAGILAACAGAAQQAPGPAFRVSEIERCPADGSVLPATDSEYGRELIAQIDKHAFYPHYALRFKQAGVAQLCVEVNRNGVIQRALVMRSSGQPMLDGAALYAVGGARAANRPLRNPDEQGDTARNAWFMVPVGFRLDEKLPMPPTAAEERPQACSSIESARAPTAGWWRSRQFSDYEDGLMDQLQSHLVFPQEARSQRESGVTEVCVLIGRSGYIEQARIWRSGGNPFYDGMVLMALGVMSAGGEIAPLPAATPAGTDSFPLLLPVVWSPD